MAKADNGLLLYRNLVDEATVTASSAVTGAAATQVQTLDPGEPWRATAKTSEYLHIDFGSVIDATHAAAVYHNLDTTGLIRFRGSNDPTFVAADVVDTDDQDAWDPVAGFGFDGFGSSLGGYPILSRFNDYRPLKYFDFGGVKSFRYGRMYFKNPSNAAITGVACGRAFVGLGAQFERNFGLDWDLRWVDPSDLIETEATVRVKARTKYRVLTMAFPWLSEAEAMSTWDDIKRSLGSSKDIIAVLFPTGSTVKRYRTTIYGLCIDRAGTRNPHYDVFASQLQVRELAVQMY